ncbi:MULTISPECIES: M28 family metallopeptidase [unclassified Sphingomonas]|uniref:M28 family metallopeptidase n=1 Tax=unclassified Sphingomonas TaxID=196159 RepID=UPI00267E8B4F
MDKVTKSLIAAITALALITPAVAPARQKQRWTVKTEWVLAHETFLAGPELQGRGSATRDEAIAAAYVAAQFRGFGLKPAPGLTGYTQSTNITRMRLNGRAVLTAAGTPLAGASLLIASGQGVRGALTVFAGDDAKDLPAADVVVATSTKANGFALLRAATAKKIKLLIIPESDLTRARVAMTGGEPQLPLYAEGAAPPPRTALASLPAAVIEKLAKGACTDIALRLPEIVLSTGPTTNAVGYLPGTDPKAGVLLISAHLDHIGVRGDGVVMPGANDDASGTTAVIELARALAAGKPMKRGILFVAYGSEEAGGFGAKYFVDHPPVPLTQIIANLEIEMIGAQDPKLPKGVMMMTGYDRSTFGEALKSHGALVTADPYPEQNFFQRSDNYALALQGVVAHTVSGWAVVPTYHSPNDTVENIDIAFMTAAIQSLIEPMRWLADSGYVPAWKPGGKPGK